jgi:hypothetical protein
MASVSESGVTASRSSLVTRGPDAVLTLFAILWGAAALFHNLGPSGRSHAVFQEPAPLKVAQALLTVAAFWLILRPRKLGPLLAVAALGLVTAWMEAPRLGNHWLLTAFIDLGILLSVLAVRRRGPVDREALAAAILPTARWCLITFYSFAAFAKLNPAFFDPLVSCGTFFFDETARSYGLDTPLAVGSDGLGRLITFGSALTELSIPVLLAVRRTRVIGVLLGLVFHSLIALDRIHLFIDFSGLLAALFLLFMPLKFAEDALAFLESDRGKRLFAFTVGFALLVTGAQLTFVNNLAIVLFLLGRMLVWFAFDLIVVIGTARWLLRNRRSYEALDRPFAVPANARLLLVPLMVVVALNGVLPYLELRTAYAYTMYSNLKMVGGESNHFLVQKSLPIGGRQENLVKILATNDFGLSKYVNSGYELPWDTFRTYMAEHPEVSVTYARNGRQVNLDRAADDPELIDAPPLLAQKLFPLRTVDSIDPPKCQDVFLPAL